MAHVTRNLCKEQIGRMLGMPFTPQTSSALKEAIDALQRYAKDDAHVRRIVDDCLRCDRFPAPADIMRIAYAEPRPERKPEPDCKLCEGIGWLQKVVIRNGERYEGSDRCQCWATAEVPMEACA